MLSNKLTFSLVFVLALALVAGSAMAQDISIAATDVPAKGMFTVLAEDATAATTDINGIVAAVTEVTADTMPDLYDILANGGSIELSIAQRPNDEAGTATTYTVAHDATAADIAKLKHHLVISEIMWAYNGGGANRANAQWLEIYGNLGDLMASDALMIHFSTSKQTGRVPGEAFEFDPDPAVDDDEVPRVVLDQVSTIDQFGRSWGLKGQHGSTESGVNDDGTFRAPIYLVSMSRNNDLTGVGTDTVYKDTSFGDGNDGGQWSASATRENMTGAFTGTPGEPPHAGPATAANPGSIATNGIIINEVRNDTSAANLDWFEVFYNGDPATDNPINIDGYELNIVEPERDADGNITGPKKERTLINFPKYKLSAGEYFVVYNRHPGDTILAGGINVVDVENGEQINKGASHAYFVTSNLNLPNAEKFLLVLRSANDQDNEPDAIKDFAGNGFFTVVESDKAGGFDPDHRYDTRAFPMNGWGVPGDQEAFGDNTFASATQSFARETVLTADGTYRPESTGNRVHKDNWLTHGYMGGTGYDRDVDTRSAVGTPGYANVSPNNVSDDRDNSDAKDDYAFSGTVTISEIMYDAGPRWNLIQWIELYNSSMTETIDIAGWTLEIRNLDTAVESFVDSSFNFEANTRILPNQTLLLVSGTGANDVEGDRVYNLYQHHRTQLGLLARDSRLLSRDGFYLKLSAKANAGGQGIMVVMDEVGNLMVDGTTRTKMWDLPPRGDVRQSLLRQYGTRVIDGSADPADDGTMSSSWVQSDLTGAGLSFYGHRDDIGTPGYRLGGPLPVSLSSFRPVRNDATGHVDITWVTESELNNAGFNILRSESKTGEFQVINVKGIVAGHGTTSEKHVYTYTDTTAKPNVVYYYQIEDVSLDGNRTTLRTTHLRGNVSAGGKLTTTWGDLKTQ